MEQAAGDKLVSAIVPALNEERQLASVLSVLTTYPGFSEVIVVDDGSTDRTAEIAQRFPVRYIRNPTNLGKGGSMERGVEAAKSEIVFFCDADLISLTHEVIHDIVEPVVAGDTDMNIGMHARRLYSIPLLLMFTPKIGGERALHKSLWWALPSYYKIRFRIEVGLNAYAKRLGKKYSFVLVPLHRVKKEQKLGFWYGLFRRLWMWADLIQTATHLFLKNLLRFQKPS